MLCVLVFYGALAIYGWEVADGSIRYFAGSVAVVAALSSVAGVLGCAIWNGD